MTRRAMWRPVSVRLLVPELDAALGVGGRVVDWLHSCYGSVYPIDGRPVQFEYYFTTSTVYFFDPRLPLSFWDQPDNWWRACDSLHYPTDGSNPCPRVPSTPRPFPRRWRNPEISTGHRNQLEADDQGNTIWWY